MEAVEPQELANWLQQRMAEHRIAPEAGHERVSFRALDADGQEVGALSVPAPLLREDREWPSEAELHRAMETANVASLLAKGRRLRLRSDDDEEPSKVWVEDE